MNVPKAWITFALFLQIIGHFGRGDQIATIERKECSAQDYLARKVDPNPLSGI